MRFTPLTVGLLLLSSLRAEALGASVEDLLDADRRAEGVVFEIIAWQEYSWDWAAPPLRRRVERLRAKYPGIEMAPVSHRADLFDLTRRAGLRQQASIRALSRLRAEGLEICVCGEYAAWKRLGPKGFLDFGEATASGSAQLAAYFELGFAQIRLEPTRAAD